MTNRVWLSPPPIIQSDSVHSNGFILNSEQMEQVDGARGRSGRDAWRSETLVTFKRLRLWPFGGRPSVWWAGDSSKCQCTELTRVTVKSDSSQRCRGCHLGTQTWSQESRHTKYPEPISNRVVLNVIIKVWIKIHMNPETADDWFNWWSQVRGHKIPVRLEWSVRTRVQETSEPVKLSRNEGFLWAEGWYFIHICAELFH